MILVKVEERTGTEEMRTSFLGAEFSWDLVPDHISSDFVGLRRRPLTISQLERQHVQSFNIERRESIGLKVKRRVMSSA